MAMGTEIAIASALAGLNVLLLSALTVVWVRNYRTFRAPLVLGLVLFAVVLLAENAVAIYFFFSMRSLYAADPLVQTAVAVLRGLQFVAISALTWTAWR